MDIFKFLKKIKHWVFNRSNAPVPESTGVVINTLPPYCTHLGPDLQTTLEVVTKINRSLLNKTIAVDVPLVRVSTLEWKAVDEKDVSEFLNIVALLMESLIAAMERIDDPRSTPYYRSNRIVLDLLYPKLHDELLFMKVLESSLR